MIIGLDVGGTHTDVVLLDNAGLLREVKVSTDAADLFRSVLKGLDAVTAGVDAAAIRRIVLSTTLTTNAIIQGTIPPVGMIVSAGPGIDPEHFRTNPHYVCVQGSIDHRGREVEPIRPEEIQAAGERFRKNGIRPVLFGEAIAGANLPHLAYMVSFANLAEREKNWAAFNADPDWQKLRASKEYGTPGLTSNITSAILAPLAGSDLR